jgi:hypothetical protein
LPARASGFVSAPPEAEQSINSVQKMFERSRIIPPRKSVSTLSLDDPELALYTREC